jgi:hypothetical protein
MKPTVQNPVLSPHHKKKKRKRKRKRNNSMNSEVEFFLEKGVSTDKYSS